MLARPVRSSTRVEARLDAETQAKVEDLAHVFHRTRAAILRYVIPWGLTQLKEGTVEVAIPPTVRTLSLWLDPELSQQVQAAARTHGVTGAAWLRQVTVEDFPASWRTGEVVPRSHDSRVYGQRFMLRLDEATMRTLQHLAEQFDQPRAEIIRQLIAHATLDNFPRSWPRAAQERI